MLTLIDSWLKSAVARGAGVRAPAVGDGPRRRSRRRSTATTSSSSSTPIGVGSLTVVLLTGFFTGAVLALQSGHDARSVRRAAGRRPAGQRVDDQGARARC